MSSSIERVSSVDMMDVSSLGVKASVTVVEVVHLCLVVRIAWWRHQLYRYFPCSLFLFLFLVVTEEKYDHC